MSNFTFGDSSLGYYETIAGGAGAGPTWAGQHGIHVHMTNTRITDAEILELRYPVLLREFSLRHGTGGRGRWPGGDGVVRELEFLREPFSAGILSERRAFGAGERARSLLLAHARVAEPLGMAGGGNGQRGRNLLITAAGKVVSLGGKNTVQLHKGDRIRIETPGGGAWGK